MQPIITQVNQLQGLYGSLDLYGIHSWNRNLSLLRNKGKDTGRGYCCLHYLFSLSNRIHIIIDVHLSIWLPS